MKICVFKLPSQGSCRKCPCYVLAVNGRELDITSVSNAREFELAQQVDMEGAMVWINPAGENKNRRNKIFKTHHFLVHIFGLPVVLVANYGNKRGLQVLKIVSHRKVNSTNYTAVSRWTDCVTRSPHNLSKDCRIYESQVVNQFRPYRKATISLSVVAGLNLKDAAIGDSLYVAIHHLFCFYIDIGLK